MPSYYNPYNFFPATYPQQSYMQQPQYQQQSYAPQQAPLKAMEWVEGEVGAKAFQMPQGWPANQPIPLWDSTDTNIYLKSWSQMGIPNPMQKLHYEMPEQQNQALLQSGNGNNSGNMSGTPQNYITKEDFEAFKNEVKTALQNQSGTNQNGNQNRAGGNR